MGSLTVIECRKCDFKIIPDGDEIFYIDSKLVETMSLMLKGKDKDNEMWGHIERTYCPNCDKIIKTYIIRESIYPKEESIIKLEEILKKSDVNETHNIGLLKWFQKEDELNGIEFKMIKMDFLEKFQKNENISTIVQAERYWKTIYFETLEESLEYKRNLKNSKISCPCCGEELYRKFSAEKCPICESKLECGFFADID